jgi:hypothetical protein
MPAKIIWSGRLDLNQRPHGPQTYDDLPSQSPAFPITPCSTGFVLAAFSTISGFPACSQPNCTRSAHKIDVLCDRAIARARLDTIASPYWRFGFPLDGNPHNNHKRPGQDPGLDLHYAGGQFPKTLFSTGSSTETLICYGRL